MSGSVAFHAQRNQIVFGVIAQGTSEEDVMNLELT